LIGNYTVYNVVFSYATLTYSIRYLCHYAERNIKILLQAIQNTRQVREKKKGKVSFFFNSKKKKKKKKKKRL